MSDPEGDEKFFIGARPTLERFTEIEEIVAGLLKRMSNIERHCYQHDTIQHRIKDKCMISVALWHGCLHPGRTACVASSRILRMSRDM